MEQIGPIFKFVYDCIVTMQKGQVPKPRYIPAIVESLFGKGAMTAKEIRANSEIEMVRTKVYVNLNKMVERGLVVKIIPQEPPENKRPYLWDYWTPTRQIKWRRENGYPPVFTYILVDDALALITAETVKSLNQVKEAFEERIAGVDKEIDELRKRSRGLTRGLTIEAE